MAVGALALGLAAWALLGPTSASWRGGPAGDDPVSCGSFLLPRHLPTANADAAVDHDQACASPRRRQAAGWGAGAFAIASIGATLALSGGPSPRLPDLEPS